MYRNRKQWARIRERLSSEGATIRGLSRELGISRVTLRKIVDLPSPPPFARTGKRVSTLEPYRATIEKIVDDTILDPAWPALSASRIFRHLRDDQGYAGGYTIVREYVRRLAAERPLVRRTINRTTPDRAALPSATGLVRRRPGLRDLRRAEEWEWLRALVQKDGAAPEVIDGMGNHEDTAAIAAHLYSGRLSDRNRAAVILSRRKGVCGLNARAFLGIAKGTYYRYVRLYEESGVDGLFARKAMPHRKFDNEPLKHAVFRTLHEPPSKYGINRTSWIMRDLSRVLGENGYPAGRDVICRITREAGYKWRKARVQLTSCDPAYREKLEAVQNTLSGLRADEAFFSIDEFGPFAVKMKQGLKLDPPGPHRVVPQWQESRGCMIMTAALELSGNQVTHFYSDRKNTTEMIRMMDVLLERYADRRTIYLSWDAASWHVSKKLRQRIEDHNATAEAARKPLVEMAPLPAGAQFLNVIESVFSGMARAIIHNSDYALLDDTKAAIDRYFADRNQQFQESPKRAGNRIWGKELVPPVFSDSQNCKDPRWR